MARPAFARFRALEGSPGLLPGGLVLLVGLYWAARDGGFDPLRWLPGTAFVLALVLVVVLVARTGPLPRAVVVALAALGAYTVWCFLSILWADARGDAWLGADKTLLYAAVFALFAAFRWRGGAAAALIGGLSVGIAGLAVVSVMRATVATDPGTFFIGGKFIAPTAYANANAALFLMAFFPPLVLSMRREVHPILRGTCLAAAGVLPPAALMIQSRASLAALPLVLLVLFLVTPGRVRTAVALLLVGGATLASSRTMLDVYGRAIAGEGLREQLVDARSALIATAAVLLTVGTVLAWVDRSSAASPPRWLVRAGTLALVVAVAVGATAAAVRVGNPWTRASDLVAEFRSDQAQPVDPGTPYLSAGLSGGRHDIWRVAWSVFTEHPVAGIGVDNFGEDYVQRRRRLNDSAYPHSIELRVLAQTGLVGAALFLAFLAAVGLGASRSLRGGSELDRAVAGAAVATALFWLVHGSVDWFWEMPALSVIALAVLGIAMRLGPAKEAVPRRRVSRRVLGAAAVAVGAVGLVSVALPFLAAREVEAGVAVWSTDPTAAFDRLDRARSLNPLSDEADVYAGVIAGQLGDGARQRRAFERAVERSPRNWYPYLELGVLDARQGRTRDGLARLAEARRLNPLEPILSVAQDWLEEGRVATRAELDSMLVARANHLKGGAR